MATIDGAAMEGLGQNFRGELIGPADPAYDNARAVFNGMFDKRPALIARCLGTADVQAALAFAQDQGVPLAVRAGGHSVAGFSSVDDGVVIDLSRMRGVRVDPDARTARVHAGATWGDYDRETQVYGLGSPGGLVSTTGVAGLTLGGGFGLLSFKHGLACDNLISADVVLADGTTVVASETSNPDLFWGLRGGGGNFGIVTSFEYKLHEVGPVTMGLFMFPVEEGYELIRSFRTFMNEAPDELAAFCAFMGVPQEPPMPIFPPEVLGRRVAAIIAGYPGPTEEGEKALAPLRALGKPLFELSMPLPYTMAQSMQDDDHPWGSYSYWKSAGLPDMTDDVAAIVAEKAPTAPTSHTQVSVGKFGGAIANVGEDDTAFPVRDGSWLVQMDSNWRDRSQDDENVSWTRELAGALEPFTHERAYVNFIGDEGTDRVKGAYGDARYAKLVSLKDRYDPSNVFRLNQNIEPSG